MKKQGRGIATIMFGFGYGEGFPDHSIASAEIENGGRILIRTAAADVGQGVLTTITQIAAEVLKVKPEIIRRGFKSETGNNSNYSRRYPFD